MNTTAKERHEMRTALLALEHHRRKCANGQQVASVTDRIDKLKAEIRAADQRAKERAE